MLNKFQEIRNKSDEGFTLIELMIVVVIIGVLAAIAIPIFANQQKEAINAGLKSDVKNTETNLASALVKSPTQGFLNSSTRGDGPQGTGSIQVTSAGDPNFKYYVTISDPTTTINVAGDWNAYTVIGLNYWTKTGYKFDSTTGQLTEIPYS